MKSYEQKFGTNLVRFSGVHSSVLEVNKTFHSILSQRWRIPWPPSPVWWRFLTTKKHGEEFVQRTLLFFCTLQNTAKKHTRKIRRRLKSGFFKHHELRGLNKTWKGKKMRFFTTEGVRADCWKWALRWDQWGLKVRCVTFFFSVAESIFSNTWSYTHHRGLIIQQ